MSLDFAPEPDAAPGACVFCTRIDQPPALLETEHLFVMPDRFPLLPGHTLIISKAHLTCYGAASPALLRDLDAVADRVRRFLERAYGRPVFLLENGVAGQSVFHAHLHLVPLPALPLPDDIDAHPDVRRIGGWDEVRASFAAHGAYRYLEGDGVRRLLAAYPAIWPALMDHMARVTGLQRGPEGWIRNAPLEAIDELARRWARYRREDL